MRHGQFSLATCPNWLGTEGSIIANIIGLYSQPSAYVRASKIGYWLVFITICIRDESLGFPMVLSWTARPETMTGTASYFGLVRLRHDLYKAWFSTEAILPALKISSRLSRIHRKVGKLSHCATCTGQSSTKLFHPALNYLLGQLGNFENAPLHFKNGLFQLSRFFLHLKIQPPSFTSLNHRLFIF